MKQQKVSIGFIVDRNGKQKKYDRVRIKGAIEAAFANNGINPNAKIGDFTLAEIITQKVENQLENEGNPVPNIEHIQDTVEHMINDAGYYQIARNYAIYRNRHQQLRAMHEESYEEISKIVQNTDRENANVGNGPSAKMLQMAELASKAYAVRFLLSDETLRAIEENFLYPHDLSWYAIGTTTCTYIPVGKKLMNGFSNQHGWIRPPKRFKTAAHLVAIMFQSNQNDQHGGQAIAAIDKEMAPQVKLELEWQIKRIKRTNKPETDKIKKLLVEQNVSPEIIDNVIKGTQMSDEEIRQLAWEYTLEEVDQAMEGLVYNLNTMHARAGAQVPFTSINTGTDTTPEGRAITMALLKAYKRGLGKGEQPIFPNIVFNTVDDINFLPNTPNHDLLWLGMEVMCTRLFPNFTFKDCTLDKDFPSVVPRMGCRTRVAWNRHKPKNQQQVEERGNNSFSTVNTVGLALESKYRIPFSDSIDYAYRMLLPRFNIVLPECYKDNQSIKTFFTKVNEYMDIAARQLVARFEYQGMFKKKDFPSLMDGTWMDSDKLDKNDAIREVLEHGTLSIGFIGLAETLKCLVGKHHGEDENADALGEMIVRFMQDKTVELSGKYDLNFSLLATPAEGLTGKLISKDVKKYGVIEGVTDKVWYTNSFHVPVEFEINPYEKMSIEGKYHKYCTAGSISYVEYKESPINNLPAIYKMLQHMRKSDCAYTAINFPVDRCRKCNNAGYIENDCPVCGSTDISRIRRITGYLAEIDNFNYAKQQEAKNRVKHC